MTYIIVEKKKDKKVKKVYYEVFHVTEYKDVLDKTVRIKQLAGPTTIEALKNEMKNLTEQLEYRQQILDEIADIDKRKAAHTDVAKVLAEMDKVAIA